MFLSCVATHAANGRQEMLIPLKGLFLCQIMPQRVFLSAAKNLQIAKVNFENRQKFSGYFSRLPSFRRRILTSASACTTIFLLLSRLSSSFHFRLRQRHL